MAFKRKVIPHEKYFPFSSRFLIMRSLVKYFFCKIYIAKAKTPAPIKPANTSGRQSIINIAVVLISKSVPYQRNALLMVLPNWPNVKANLVVTMTEAIAIVKAML